MAETPRHWQRQFKSTMIPSTPCTLPELACQPVHLWIYPIYIFFFFLNPSAPFPVFLLPSLLVVFSSYSLYIFWICTKAARGGGFIYIPTSSRLCFMEQFPTSVPNRAALLTSNPALRTHRGLQCTKEKNAKKQKQTIHTSTSWAIILRLFLFFLFECLYSCVYKIHWAREWAGANCARTAL